MMTNCNQFKVVEEVSPGRFRGDLVRNELGGDIRRGQPGFLRCGSSWIQGKWEEVETAWIFAAVGQTKSPAPSGECEVFDFYWGDRARIAMDESLVWNECSIAKHVHCAICWTTLGDGDNQKCFQSDQDDIVCPDCFRDYVTKRSLDFIKPSKSRPEK